MIEPVLDLLMARGNERAVIAAVFVAIAQEYNQLSHDAVVMPSLSNTRSQLREIAAKADALLRQIDGLPAPIVTRLAERDGVLGRMQAVDSDGRLIIGFWLEDLVRNTRKMRSELAKAGGPGGLFRLDYAHLKARLAATCAELAVEFCPQLLDAASERGLLPLTQNAFEFATGASVERPGGGLDHHVKHALRCYRAMLEQASGEIDRHGPNGRYSIEAGSPLDRARDKHVIGRKLIIGRTIDYKMDPKGPKLFPFFIAESIGGRQNLRGFW